jgi:hypothetical protein
MRNSNRVMAVIGLLFFLGIGANISAQEDKVEFSLTADYFGKYVWRGQNLNDDPAFQPGFIASYKGLTAGVWGSLDTTDIHHNSGEFTEIDYYAYYSGDVPGIDVLGFSVGAIYYDFPNTTYNGTTELYWGLNMDVPLKPSVTFYHDIDEADGLYISTGISHTIDKIFELGSDVPVALELGASYGWADSSYNEYYWGVDSNKANDLSLSSAFPFEISGWSIKPSLKYAMLISEDIKDADTYDTDNNIFYVGIGFAKTF